MTSQASKLTSKPRVPPPDLDQVPDATVVAQLLAGDEGAFRWLVTKHHAALLRLAQIFVSAPSVAEEVVQETWLAVLAGLPKFEGRSSLKTWIFRILTNRAKTRGVREGRSVPFSALVDDGDSEPVVDPSRFKPDGHWQRPPPSWGADLPERMVVNKEARAHLEAAIAALPPNQRAVITLRDIQGWDSKDVCDLLDVSESNQRVLLHRARGRVRAAIEKFLGDD